MRRICVLAILAALAGCSAAGTGFTPTSATHRQLQPDSVREGRYSLLAVGFSFERAPGQVDTGPAIRGFLPCEVDCTNSAFKISVVIPGQSSVYLGDVTTDSAGRVYATGTYTGDNIDHGWLAIYNKPLSNPKAPDELLTSFTGPYIPVEIGPIAVDGSGRIYIGGSGRIWIYPPLAHGEAQPIASIRSPDLPTAFIQDIAFDARGNLYVSGISNTLGPEILEFPGNHFGNVAPSRALYGVVANSITAQSDGTIYALRAGNFLGGGGPGAVQVFSPSARGYAAPIRTIAGPHTLLDRAVSMAVCADGQIYVDTEFDPPAAPAKLLTFRPLSRGDVPPAHVTVLDGAAGALSL